MVTLNIEHDTNGDNRPDVYDYIENPGDKMLTEMLQELIDNVELCRRGIGSRRRALFLMGALAPESRPRCFITSAGCRNSSRG